MQLRKENKTEKKKPEKKQKKQKNGKSPRPTPRTEKKQKKNRKKTFFLTEKMFFCNLCSTHAAESLHRLTELDCRTHAPTPVVHKSHAPRSTRFEMSCSASAGGGRLAMSASSSSGALLRVLAEA